MKFDHNEMWLKFWIKLNLNLIVELNKIWLLNKIINNKISKNYIVYKHELIY